MKSKTSLLMIATGLIALMTAQSSISYVGLLVGTFACVIAEVPRKHWNHLSILGLIGVFGGAFALGRYVKPQFFDHISRYDAWPMFTKYILVHSNAWLGAGFGSFKFLGPYAQIENNFMRGQWWLWAHNDWLQIFLEIGWIGLGLSIAAYLCLLKRSWNRPLIFAAIVAYSVTMIGNYPLHIPATNLLGWFLVFEVIYESKKV